MKCDLIGRRGGATCGIDQSD